MRLSTIFCLLFLVAAAGCDDEPEPVAPSGPFTVALEPSRITSLVPGDDIGLEVGVVPFHVLDGPVDVVVTGLPPGVTATTARVTTRERAVLRLVAAADAAPTIATAVVEARHGDRLVEVPLEIHVIAERARGTVDTSFGVGGVALGPEYTYRAGGLVALPDGGIVMLVIHERESLLLFFDRRGRPDPARATVRIPHQMFVYTQVRSVTLLADGDLALLVDYNGYGDRRGALVRVAPDGTLRPPALFDEPGYDWRGIAIDADRVTVVGEAFNGAAIARFAYDGSVDTSFGNRGLLIEDLGMPDGWRGISSNGTEQFMAGIGYLGYGTVIGRIAADGVHTARVPFDQYCCTAIDSHGRGLLARGGLSAVRFAADLTVDTSFGTPAASVADAQPVSTSAILVLPDDGVLVAGSPEPYDLGAPDAGMPVDREGVLLGHLDADGNTVPFGADTTTRLRVLDGAYGFAFAPDGALLVLGYVSNASSHRAAVTRVVY